MFPRDDSISASRSIPFAATIAAEVSAGLELTLGALKSLENDQSLALERNQKVTYHGTMPEEGIFCTKYVAICRDVLRYDSFPALEYTSTPRVRSFVNVKNI